MTRANFFRRETERLVLRAIVADDWPAIQCYMSDPVVTKWLPEGVMNEGQSRVFANDKASQALKGV